MISLSINNSYNTIFIIVNYLIKERHYILYTIFDNNTIIGATVKLLLNHI